ncbi:MAG: hypothetical protein AB8B94_07905, partial [Hyphomicrobiales bacterium]
KAMSREGGPVEAMPKHKQAGQTTVLTKRPRKSLKNSCIAGATHRRHWHGANLLPFAEPESCETLA